MNLIEYKLWLSSKKIKMAELEEETGYPKEKIRDALDGKCELDNPLEKSFNMFRKLNDNREQEFFKKAILYDVMIDSYLEIDINFALNLRINDEIHIANPDIYTDKEYSFIKNFTTNKQRYWSNPGDYVVSFKRYDGKNVFVVTNSTQK